MPNGGDATGTQSSAPARPAGSRDGLVSKRALVVLVLLIANAVVGEIKLPETAPGKQFQEWLTAFNAADEAALRKFAQERSSPAARQGRSADDIVEGQIFNRRSSKGFDVAQIEQSSPTELIAVTKSRGTFPFAPNENPRPR